MSERETPTQGSGLPHWWVLTKDVASLVGGWVLIFTEVQRTELRESVLVLAAGIVGIPSAAIGARTVAEAWQGRQGGTDPPSSPQAEVAPSQPSPLP